MKRILLLSVVVLLGLYTTGFAAECKFNISSNEFYHLECAGGLCYGYNNWTFTFDCGGDCSGEKQCEEEDSLHANFSYLSYMPTGSCTEPADCTTWDLVYWEYYDYICTCVDP